jgi:hypothetical protein
MSASLRAMDPAEMLRIWFPIRFKGFEQMFEALARMVRPKGE